MRNAVIVALGLARIRWAPPPPPEPAAPAPAAAELEAEPAPVVPRVLDELDEQAAVSSAVLATTAPAAIT